MSPRPFVLRRAYRRGRPIDESLADVLPGAAGWVFSPAFLWQVADGRHRALLRRLGVTRVLGAHTTIAEMYERIYEEMLHSYRVEYVYKNEIIRKLFIARHDPDRAAVVLEQPIDNRNTRLDLLVVNDTTTVYEVKTAHDSLMRLNRQTTEALRVFDRVVVACPNTHLDNVRSLIDERVGIVLLGPRGGLRSLRAPSSNAARVDPLAIFSVLHRRERERAVVARFGALPSLPPLERYEWCRERFGRIRPQDAHDILLASLTTRHVRPGRNAFSEELLPAMTHLGYKLTSAERRRLLSPRILGRPIG